MIKSIPLVIFCADGDSEYLENFRLCNVYPRKNFIRRNVSFLATAYFQEWSVAHIPTLKPLVSYSPTYPQSLIKKHKLLINYSKNVWSALNINENYTRVRIWTEIEIILYHRQLKCIYLGTHPPANHEYCV